MTATNWTKSQIAKSMKPVINSTQAKPITKSVTFISNSRRRGPSPTLNGHRDLDKVKRRTASTSNGHTSRVNPAEVTVGEVMDDDSSHPSSDDEESDDESDKLDDESNTTSDTESDGQSNDESADDFFR